MENRWFHKIGSGNLCEKLDELAQSALPFLYEKNEYKTKWDISEPTLLTITILLFILLILFTKFTAYYREKEVKYSIVNTEQCSEILSRYLNCFTLIKQVTSNLQISRDAFNENIYSSLHNHLEDKRIGKENRDPQDHLTVPTIYQLLFQLEKLSISRNFLQTKTNAEDGSIINEYSGHCDKSTDPKKTLLEQYCTLLDDDAQEYVQALNWYLLKCGASHRVSIKPSNMETGTVTPKDLVDSVNTYLMFNEMTPISYEDVDELVATVLNRDVSVETDLNLDF